MPWDTESCERRVSGGRAQSCSKVSRVQPTKPRGGGFFSGFFA